MWIEKSGQIDNESREKAYKQVSNTYRKDPLIALQILRAEHRIDKWLGSITPEKVESWKNTPINVDSRLFINYREYYDHPADESDEPIVTLSSYGVDSRDVHYQYSINTRETLVRGQKLDTILEIDAKKSEQVISRDIIEKLSFDEYQKLDAAQKKIVIQNGLDVLWLKTRNWVSLDSENIEKIRLYLCLHYGNIALRKVVPKNGDIHVRSSIGALLGAINQKLSLTWYRLGVENGYRSSERQLVAKENRIRTHGLTDANRLFADEWKSDHQTGWAVDVILIWADGKKVNLDLFKDKKSQVKLMDGESIMFEKWWNTLSIQEKQAIEWRRLVYHIMKASGFTELETEHWHYALWARLPALIESRKTQILIPAKYGSLMRKD
jgi:D-alanyl-D-alanine dipeptidase